jgi:hypothetical protein
VSLSEAPLMEGTTIWRTRLFSGRRIEIQPPQWMSFVLIKVLPHSWCKSTPPNARKQLKRFGIECPFQRGREEVPFKAMSAKHNGLGIYNLATLLAYQTCTKSEEEPH